MFSLMADMSAPEVAEDDRGLHNLIVWSNWRVNKMKFYLIK
jgi:hypothetical protein